MERAVRRGEIVELASVVKYASQYAGRRGYFSLIAGAIFSAGAAGSAVVDYSKPVKFTLNVTGGGVTYNVVYTATVTVLP